MNRNMRLFLCVASALAVFACVAAPVSAQVVPDTVDPYELAPQNVHLYPFSLNARMPFYYLPPIFAPTPMWRGALDEQIMHTMAPHNYVVMEIPDSTALVAWGTVKKDKRFVLEAANQQEFVIMPPGQYESGAVSSYDIIRTEMRYLPECTMSELNEILERELILDPSRVDSYVERIPVDELMFNFDRVDDTADLQPRIHPVLDADEFATQTWPVERIYINHSGWRLNANVIRTNPDSVSQWMTSEGKLIALKEHAGEWYLLKVSWEALNPWYPIETAKNVMRKMIALSFDEFVESAAYYDFEKPLNGKEWHRFGSGLMTPYDTRLNTGTGSAGQGAY